MSGVQNTAESNSIANRKKKKYSHSHFWVGRPCTSAACTKVKAGVDLKWDFGSSINSLNLKMFELLESENDLTKF